MHPRAVLPITLSTKGGPRSTCSTQERKVDSLTTQTGTHEEGRKFGVLLLRFACTLAGPCRDGRATRGGMGGGAHGQLRRDGGGAGVWSTSCKGKRCPLRGLRTGAARERAHAFGWRRCYRLTAPPEAAGWRGRCTMHPVRLGPRAGRRACAAPHTQHALLARSRVTVRPHDCSHRKAATLTPARWGAPQQAAGQMQCLRTARALRRARARASPPARPRHGPVRTSRHGTRAAGGRPGTRNAAWCRPKRASKRCCNGLSSCCCAGRRRRRREPAARCPAARAPRSRRCRRRPAACGRARRAGWPAGRGRGGGAAGMGRRCTRPGEGSARWTAAAAGLDKRPGPSASTQRWRGPRKAGRRPGRREPHGRVRGCTSPDAPGGPAPASPRSAAPPSWSPPRARPSSPRPPGPWPTPRAR
jgi:hypothetical protein